MKITLISHTPEPEKLITAAAKLCYSSLEINEILNKMDEEKCGLFIKKLIKLGHESPLEHASFTFGIEKVSRVFLSQITRHRIASFSVRSQRYVPENKFNFIIPKKIADNSAANFEFLSEINNIKKSYEKITRFLCKNNNLCENTTKKLEKDILEIARYILPGATESKIICTFNARSLLNFFKLRCCNRAQLEIRNAANEMLNLVKKIAPNIFATAGPPCITGECRQGAMACAKKIS
ncbi:MAG: FAD-dependent thymidylate synthase [Candidatus Improbicoccus devescovinae]|nr:MAG: FAD-dependent thymidylate synthase [Candidatus Improbicoccus devescovinae]